ncbi:hypothetical protein [Pseudomonas fluorescens]|uniref:Uncharacterized protein n=1 Tax=Pseudomonas fluorescens TaxID=294 RepID=A0A5E7EV00_PSEFL|nr:hypothetical protein [Pseudomonas fluorescens]VVO30728.1 hypothetical protein PS723_04969 [Pseudomonas fluorescens]
MHSKNNTTELSAQHSEPNSEESSVAIIVTMTQEQKFAVAALIVAERAHASRWWSYLNELRCRRELPEWVAKQSAGNHPDYDLWADDCKATNLALLGIAGHLNDPGWIAPASFQAGVIAQ